MGGGGVNKGGGVGRQHQKKVDNITCAQQEAVKVWENGVNKGVEIRRGVAPWPHTAATDHDCITLMQRSHIPTTHISNLLLYPYLCSHSLTPPKSTPVHTHSHRSVTTCWPA